MCMLTSRWGYSGTLVRSVSETNSLQWVDWGGGNRWRWIWRRTSCKTSGVGNSCLQGTEVYNHSGWLKVCYSNMYSVLLTLISFKQKWNLVTYCWCQQAVCSVWLHCISTIFVLSYVSYISTIVTSAVATSCCISDEPCQWEKANFDPPQLHSSEMSWPMFETQI